MADAKTLTILLRRGMRWSDGAPFTAEDMYHGSRLGAAECVFSGITTAADFCHNAAGEEFVAACLAGLGETGLRTRFLFGATPTMRPEESMDLGLLQRRHAAFARDALPGGER